jgi:hypothetical protein
MKMRKMGHTYNILVRISQWERSLERCRYRLEETVKMNLSEIEYNGLNWFRLGLMVGFCEHGDEP